MTSGIMFFMLGSFDLSSGCRIPAGIRRAIWEDAWETTSYPELPARSLESIASTES